MTKPSWADMFMALFYAAIILLFTAWLGKLDVAPLPSQAQAMVRDAWCWAVALPAGLLASYIFRDRISVITLLITCVLIVGIAYTAYVVRSPQSIAPEKWATTEGETGEFHSVWNVTFKGDPFPCPIDAGRPATCVATGWGKYRSVDRISSPTDGNLCSFFLSQTSTLPSTFEADYHCNRGRKPHFKATVMPSADSSGAHS